MIKQILKMGGCKTEKEFYKKYPTEESFLEAFPQAQRMMKQFQKGGLKKAQLGGVEETFSVAGPSEYSRSDVYDRLQPSDWERLNMQTAGWDTGKYNEDITADALVKAGYTADEATDIARSGFSKSSGPMSGMSKHFLRPRSFNAGPKPEMEAEFYPPMVKDKYMIGPDLKPYIQQNPADPRVNPILAEENALRAEYGYKKGGAKSLAFPQAPTADRFFNYGLPAMNIPRPMQEGGQSEQIKNTPILEMIKAVAEYNGMEEADVIQTLQENIPAEQLQMLTEQAVSDPESVAQALNQYVQQIAGASEEIGMESQYLEGQPLMQDMLEQQAMAEETSEEPMPMDPNMAMQMAYGGSKLRRFTRGYQTGGPKYAGTDRNQSVISAAPPEDDSFLGKISSAYDMMISPVEYAGNLLPWLSDKAKIAMGTHPSMTSQWEAGDLRDRVEARRAKAGNDLLTDVTYDPKTGNKYYTTDPGITRAITGSLLGALVNNPVDLMYTFRNPLTWYGNVPEQLQQSIAEKSVMPLVQGVGTGLLLDKFAPYAGKKIKAGYNKVVKPANTRLVNGKVQPAFQYGGMSSYDNGLLPFQIGGQNKPAPAPAQEEDSFWDTGWGMASKIGAGGVGGAIGVEVLSRFANSEMMRSLLGMTEEAWKSLSEGQRLKKIGQALKKGVISKKGAGALVGATVIGLGEYLDWWGSNPEVVAPPAQAVPKAPALIQKGIPADSADADRIPVMNNTSGVDSLKAVQEQMLLNKSQKKAPSSGVKYNFQQGGIPSSNYGQFTVPMQKGGQSAPMGVMSNDDVISRRMETLRRYVSDNVYNNMINEEAEEIQNAGNPQAQMMQQGEEEYMKFGGRLKKKGRTDERLRMALQGRLDYMQPGGQSDGLTSAFGYVFPPAKAIGNMLDRRTTDVRTDAPAPDMSTVGPVQGQGTQIDLGGYTNVSSPTGAYNPYTPQSSPELEQITNMVENQNKALNQYETVEGTGKQCPPGYKWDPKRGECVVAQTRAGKALDKVGEWWQNKSGDERANMVLGMANSVVGAKEQMNQRKYEEQLEKQMFNKFTTSVTAPTDKGMHMVNQRTPVPPTMMTPVQFTGQNYTQGYGYAQMGGEMYLSDDEIQNIISMGGQVEYLD